MNKVLAGYTLTQVIHEEASTTTYAGIWQPEGQSVVLKVPRAEYPSLEGLTQLRHEYKILQAINIEGVIKPVALNSYQNSLILVLEGFDGITLQQFLQQQSLPIHQFLQIAGQLVAILAELHQNQIVHKDINSQNILINPATGQVKLMGFSLSSRLSRENPTVDSPTLLDGTLAYLSPEQTGRMNRVIDYRTDFYSLGVTFYEMLTRQLPFQSTDALELIHCHIAKTPVPPNHLNPEIPQAIADLVMKLLAKTAEDRYQSALGLNADLVTCQERLQPDGKITPFAIGQLDCSSQFLIPQRLYGREKEVATLLAAFDRVSAGATEIMLVSGYSGVGKSSLVNEVHKPIVRQRGYFISGKFDQFKRNIPYASLIQAFQELMHQILTESDEKISIWKAKLLDALGTNGQIIIDVIPEVEQIIGPQPGISQLSPSELQNRFNRVFQQFIHVFSQPEHPLVVFLDDLQWADLPSLKLLQLMVTGSHSQYILLLGAYRDNEVNATHPLIQTLEQIQQTGAIANHIVLQPLKISHVNQLIAHTLHIDTHTTQPLTNLVFKKTQGNPFFLTQLLKSLYQENLLSFDFNQGCWQWNLGTLQEIDITENVVGLMVSQIQKLSKKTQTVLKLAACVGDKFTLDVLAIINQKSQSETARDLWEALQMEFVVPLNNSYKIPLVFDQEIVDNQQDLDSIPQLKTQVAYKFLHDRVQQAAYSLILESQRKETHLKIGQLLLQNTSEDEQKENIFTLVNQLNYGIDLLSSEQQKYQLAELNLLAGQKARASAAYDSALRYLNIGLKLLGTTSWQNHYELTLAIYESAAETAYLNGDFEQMEQWSTVVLQAARTPSHKMKVYEVKIQACMAQLKQLAAVKIGLQALEQLGVTLPESPEISEIQQTLTQTATNLVGKSTEDLFNLPLMSEVEKLAAIRMLTSMGSPSYQAAPTLFPLVICEQVNLSIQHGNSPFSAYGYVCYGVILNGFFQDAELAYQFGQLALRLVEQFNALDLKTSVFYVAGSCTIHGKVHVRETLSLLQESYSSGLENGQFEYGCYAAAQKCQYSYFIGQALPRVEREMAAISESLAQLKQENTLSWNQIFHQSVLILMKPSEHPACLAGEVYNEERSLPLLKKANDRTSLHYFYLNKLILCYLFGEYRQAVENAAQAEQFLDGVKAFLAVPVFHFYDSLAQLAVYSSLSPDHQEALLNRVVSNQEKMGKWAASAPMNFQHKYDLVEAEKSRVLGQYWQAMEGYDRAIAAAREHGYIQEEALANELAARFYLAQGREKIAQVYLVEAHYGYLRWGATAKVQQLTEQYSQMLAPEAGGTLLSPKPFATTNTLSTDRSSALDLATVIKASQTLSGEIVQSNLLAKLMQIVLENAGAERGYLLLEKAGQLLIEASGGMDTDEVTVKQSIPVETGGAGDRPLLPISIINYVGRTQEPVVLSHATEAGIFDSDPYVVNQKPKSILCLPILHQGKLTGILYLENNLVTGAFTPDRLELLQLLSTQAAISIENARLYSDLAEVNRTLEVKVATRTAQLQEKNLDLQQEIRERQRAEEAAQVANRAKSEFLANMSHELRTPLNGILGYTQILKRTESLTEQQKNGLGVIHQCGEYLLTLINDVLDLSKIEARKMELYPNTFSLSKFLSNVIEICQIRASQKKVPLNYQVLSPLPEFVWADERRLQQVLINLLGNAIKFTETGSVTFKVGTVASFEPTALPDAPDHQPASHSPPTSSVKIRFQIEDTGSGIPPQQLEQIFLPFHRADEHIRQTEGTGLGLAISRQLVKLMGGIIAVQSTVGEGSRFWVDVDLVQAVQPSDREQSIGRIITGYQSDSASRDEVVRRTILVVDDKDLNRSVLVHLLKPLGFTVIEATNGQDGLEKALEFKPDAILVDLVMPVMDGFEMTRQIRMESALKSVIVIAISASVFEFDQQMSQEACCNDFLPKPVQESILLEKLRVHLGLKWTYGEDADLPTPRATEIARSFLSPSLRAANSHPQEQPLSRFEQAGSVMSSVPPAQELAQLLDLALMGDLKGVVEASLRLKQMNPQWTPFVTQLEQLARGFKGKQVIELIQQCQIQE